MNNLEEKIKEIEKQLEELKEQLKEESTKEDINYERKRLEKYEHYWYLDYKIGNYFETKEKAENYKERLLIEQELKDIAMELNEDKKMFWSNNNLLSKYYLRYNFDDDRIITDCSYGSKIQGTIYCLDNNFEDVAIERIGEKRITKYLKGELD